MDRVVVDANVFVKWFIEEDYTREALLIREDHIAGCVRILAPAYALLEVADALRKYATREVISTSDAVEALNILLEFDVDFVGLDKKLVMEALNYSLENRVTVYDSYYIAIARTLGLHFYTADEKLLSRIQANQVVARHIKDYRPKCAK